MPTTKKSPKPSNEITIQLLLPASALAQKLRASGYRLVNEFQLDDTYFIPRTLDRAALSPREIIAHAILARDIHNFTSHRHDQKLTFKVKNFSPTGDILSQSAFDCPVTDLAAATAFLEALDFIPLMSIEEHDQVYEKDHFSIALKDIKNLPPLAEVETNSHFPTIDSLIAHLKSTDLPFDPSNFFVKKAELAFAQLPNPHP